MGKFFAVNGAQLSLSAGTGNISISGVLSSDVKASGNYAYKGQIAFSVSGYTGINITTPGSGAGSGVINGSSVNFKIDGESAVLLGDSVEITINGTKPASSGTGTEPATDVVTVAVSDCGQTVCKVV